MTLYRACTWCLDAVAGVPNNATLPLVVLPAAFAIDASHDLAGDIEARFDANGWRPAWRYGVFAFHHFHTTAHEALGAYRGHGKVQFGGPDGPVLSVAAGDVVVIPAGVGHCLVAGEGLTFVGAYPYGQQPDQWRAGEGDAAGHRRRVATTALPSADPAFGPDGPLLTHWSPTAT